MINSQRKSLPGRKLVWLSAVGRAALIYWFFKAPLCTVHRLSRATRYVQLDVMCTHQHKGGRGSSRISSWGQHNLHGRIFLWKKKSIPNKTTIKKKATLPTKAAVNHILEWEVQLNLQVPRPRHQPSTCGKCVVKMHLHLAQTGFSFLASLS